MKLIPLFVLLFAFTARAVQPPPPPPALKPYSGPALDLTGAVESAGFENDYFVVACWVPSFFDLEKWADRGINVAWFNQGLNPNNKSLDEYTNKAFSLGIKLWRYPDQHMVPPARKGFDEKDRTLAAYSLIDEPILHKMSAADVKDQADAFREVNPKMKLVLNMEGDKFVMPNPPPSVVEQHTGYMDACDIGFVDWYVKNRNADRYPLSHLWTAVERLCVWGKTKPVGAFIECSNQRIAPEGREPTPAEMRAQIVGSIIHGARLIAYFPEVPGKKDNKGRQFGNGNDGTPPELEKEMIAINRQLQQLAPILHAPGARLASELPGEFIGAVRWYKGTTYLIVLNDDPDAGGEFNGEKFGPYDWRVYTAGPAPVGKGVSRR
jgi:hypothetical protein